MLANLVKIPNEAKQTTEKNKENTWGSFEWHEGDIKFHANP